MTDYRGQAGTMVAVREGVSVCTKHEEGPTQYKKAGPGHLFLSMGREVSVLC